MGEYFTAYCYNPENGYDFGKEQQVPPNLFIRSSFRDYGDFNPTYPTTQDTSQFEQIDEDRRAIVKNPIDGEDSVYNWFAETGRTKSLGLRLQSNPDHTGEAYYVGMHMRSNNWVYTPEPQLKAGTVVTMSVYIYNNDDYAHTFNTRTNESNDPIKWNGASESFTGTSVKIEAKSWARLEWQHTLKYNHEGSYSEQGDLGMRVYQAKLSGTIKADFIIAMPKVEAGTKATPYRDTAYEFGSTTYWRTHDPAFRPYVGKGVTDSDNWEDYTNWTQVSTESLDNRNADIGYTKAEVHCLMLPEDAGQGIGGQRPKIWVGIDSDTFNVATGRTVQFSQLNRELNFVGHIAENETDNEGAYNYNDSTWVNMGDIMYCSQNGLLIDPVVGEMANLGEDGSQHTQGTLMRVDEVARDIIYNLGASYTGAFANVDYNQECESFRPKTASLKVASKSHPDASGGAGSYIEQIWQYGMTTKPYKINRFTTNSKWTKAITNFIYNDGVTVFSRIWNEMPDWFRGGNMGDIKPLPQRIMMINMTTKKWWWFDYNKKTGLWERSAEKTRASSAPTLITTAYANGLPKDGKLKGAVIFTDTNYADYSSKMMPSSLGLDILFPDERKENCYYAPMWHDNSYRSDMYYWGDTSLVRNNFNFNDQKYGVFGVYEINLMSGTMTLRRVWNR
jgi:hypothetical protein